MEWLTASMVPELSGKERIMDDSIRLMCSEAYDETIHESFAQGRSQEVAHREGVVAAAMFLSSLTGLEDVEARQEIEKLGLKPN